MIDLTNQHTATGARFTKDDLELGMIVEDQYGRTKVVTRLEPFDADHAPTIDSRSFGYGDADTDITAEVGTQVHGVSGVSNIERIVDEGDA